MLNDESNADESVLDEQEELSEPVGKLAEKWKQAHSLNTSLKSQMFEAEDRFLTLSTDVESSRTQKMALEKKLESAKNALKTAKLEQDELLARIEESRQQVSDVTSELAQAKSSISGSEDAISTEVLVLEEENIELLRENKDLRISSATYRAKAEALARKLGTTVDGEVGHDSAAATGVVVASAESKKRPVAVLEVGITSVQVEGGGKKVKENDENASASVGEITLSSVQKQATPSSRSFGTTLDENTLNNSSSSQQAAPSVNKPAPAVGGRRGRRVVAKAKAVESSASGTDSSGQQECTQS